MSSSFLNIGGSADPGTTCLYSCTHLSNDVWESKVSSFPNLPSSSSFSLFYSFRHIRLQLAPRRTTRFTEARSLSQTILLLKKKPFSTLTCEIRAWKSLISQDAVLFASCCGRPMLPLPSLHWPLFYHHFSCFGQLCKTSIRLWI